MAIEKFIEKGNQLRDAELYDEAIEQYDLALKESPNAFKALIEKSVVLQRTKRVDEAIEYLVKSLDVAKQRGNREQIALVYFRLATIYFKKDEIQTAIGYLNSAKDLSYDPKMVEMWTLKINRTIEKHDLSSIDLDMRSSGLPQVEKQIEEISIVQETAQEDKNSTKVPEKVWQNTDKNKKVKIDWFQYANQVTVALYYDNIPKDKLKVNYQSHSISVEFLTQIGSEFQYEISPLFGDIKPSECHHEVFPTKLEMKLIKAIDTKWKDLLRDTNQEPVQTSAQQSTSASKDNTPLSYPSSARNARDWSKLIVDDDDDEPEKQDENSFFTELYKNSNDDTRRAMMKSFVESNGTALSTNWDEVSKRKVETSPPDGLEAKKW